MAFAVQNTRLIPLLLLATVLLASPAAAFGAGYVARGSSAQGVNYRHGDILNSVYFLNHAHTILVKQIYFGNWLRDFSQLLDRKAMEVIPEPILVAIVAVFAYTQFGYTTKEFEVTPERLGTYRPEEHIDNPKGYEGGAYTKLRIQVRPDELNLEPSSGMKNYIANRQLSGTGDTSSDYIEKQLIAAIACGRARDPEAYVHLGAALHTLEDFVAHSNWVELCLRMLGQDKGINPGLPDVFPFVGQASVVSTRRGPAPPLVTGTFGALDLYQTLLGEIGDKVSAMSLPGLKMRLADHREKLSGVSKLLISMLSKFEGSSFENDITKITKSATEKPADWGQLNKAPHLLWESLEPVFRLRDRVVKWVYEHLTLKPVAEALASISTALDKLVYFVLGAVLGPVLQDIAAALQHASDQLKMEDRRVRLAEGEQSIFETASTATDPTHSQLCKDHYDHALNELSGRVATKITTFTIQQVIEIWQPGMTTDVRPVLASILETLHHPYNYVEESQIQSLMVAEVVEWSTKKQQASPHAFGALLQKLDKKHVASKVDHEEATSVHNPGSHAPAMTALYAGPNQISTATAHDLTTLPGPRQTAFAAKIQGNIDKHFPDLEDMALLKQTLVADPSGDSPNPVDSALTYVPGVGLLSVFDDINNDEIRGATGIGNLLRDAVIGLRLQDEKWLETEQHAAQAKLGELTQWKAKEMLRLLDLKAEQKSQDRPTEESKMRRMMNKMKIGSGGSST